LWAVLFVIPSLLTGPALSQETSQSKDTPYSMALVAGVAQMQSSGPQSMMVIAAAEC